MMTPLEELRDYTYRIDHNPNCPSPYLIRLVGDGEAKLYGDKKDRLYYGHTFEEALQKWREDF